MCLVALGLALCAETPKTADVAWARVSYAEGESFLLVRDNRSTRWNADDPQTFGMTLRSGDVIQTSAATFLEIAIDSISAKIRIAENTSFRLEGDLTGKQASGELLYGRVRAKVAKLTGNASFRLSSPSLVAGVRGTDFGCDAIVATTSDKVSPAADGALGGSAVGSAVAGDAVLNRVFCFEGSVVVSDERSRTVLLASNEMVERLSSQASSATQPAASGVAADRLEKLPIADEVRGFWAERPFAAESAVPVVPAVNAQAVAPASVVDGSDDGRARYSGTLKIIDRPLPEVGAEESDKRGFNYALHGTIVCSSIAIGTGLCVGSILYSAFSGGSVADTLPTLIAGLGLVGTGSVLGLLAVIYY